MKHKGYISGVKMKFKPGSETADPMTVLEYKIETTETDKFDEVCELVRSGVFIELQSEQFSMKIPEKK